MARKRHIAPRKLVIIGGGFAGLKLARKLGRNRLFDIQLISDSDHFRYYPALYRSATGHTRIESSIPLSFLLFDIPRIAFTPDSIVAIDPEKHIITGKSGEQYQYDIAVFALGVVTSYFGIPGLEKYSYGIKSIEDVLELRRHLHEELVQTGHLDKQYVVVGAGPTGVELSAELVSYLRRTAVRHGLSREKITIDLIEAAPRILPRMSERTARQATQRLTELGVRVMTGKKVESQSPNSLMVEGRSLPSETVIWTAGVANHSFFSNNAKYFALNDHGRVIVDEYMRAAQDVYVLGDNAATQYSGLAQTAISDALYLAHQLRALVAGKPRSRYRPHRPITVIPIGGWWSILEYGPLTLAGWLAALVRRAADFIGYYDVSPFFMALTLWFANRRIEDDCAICRKSD